MLVLLSLTKDHLLVKCSSICEYALNMLCHVHEFLKIRSAHDTQITPIITALDILSPTEHLPFDHIPFGNPWHVENIVPMGGHLTIERLSCNDNDDSTDSPQKYVRIVLNEAVVPFKSCQLGPGFSCPLEDYTKILSAQLPNYTKKCNVSAAYPQYLDFWWNYNTTTEYNYRDGPVGCGETVTVQ